jgi:hypothetical protein
MNVWKEQYKNIETALVPEQVDAEITRIPPICASLDLVVFRLHTASGYPTPILNYSYHQMMHQNSLDGYSSIPEFNRIGIE